MRKKKQRRFDLFSYFVVTTVKRISVRLSTNRINLTQTRTKFQVANEKNYGKSLFSRIQKLYLRKSGSPIFRINIQHRMNPEILKWPNSYFYNNSVHQNVSKGADSFPIVPYKIISYSPVQVESDYIRVVVNVLLNHLDRKKYSIGIITTDFQQKMIMQNKLR